MEHYTGLDEDDGDLRPSPDKRPVAKRPASGSGRPAGAPSAAPGSPSFIIEHNEAWKGNWDLMIMFLILYSAISVPVRVCFDAPAEGLLWTFEASMSLIFMADIGFTFRMAFTRKEDGAVVRDTGEIARRYLSCWFWIDMPSSVPVELIELTLPPGSGDAGSLSILRFLRMFRLVRLLRLLKINLYIARAEDTFEINLRPIRVLQLVLKMLFVAHLLACAWFYVGVVGFDRGEGAWYSDYDEGSLLQEGQASRQYLVSLYWALTTLTTVGYGDITPTNDLERRFTSFALLLGSLVFAYILGDIGSLLQTMDRQAALVEEKMDSVKEYLGWRDVPRDLGIRVKRYYEHYLEKRAVFDESAILHELSPNLQVGGSGAPGRWARALIGGSSGHVHVCVARAREREGGRAGGREGERPISFTFGPLSCSGTQLLWHSAALARNLLWHSAALAPCLSRPLPLSSQRRLCSRPVRHRSRSWCSSSWMRVSRSYHSFQR